MHTLSMHGCPCIAYDTACVYIVLQLFSRISKQLTLKGAESLPGNNYAFLNKYRY